MGSKKRQVNAVHTLWGYTRMETMDGRQTMQKVPVRARRLRIVKEMLDVVRGYKLQRLPCPSTQAMVV
jgi:hypothetical protein